MAQLLEADDDSAKRAVRYRKAAEQIRDSHVELQTDIGQLSALRLDKAVKASVQTVITAGVAQAFAELSLTHVPSSLRELMQLPGVGPKTARRYFDEFGIDSCAKLEEALSKATKRPLCTPAQAARLQSAISAWRERQQRIPLAWGRQVTLHLQSELRQCAGVDEVFVTGEIARACTESHAITLIATYTHAADRTTAIHALKSAGYVAIPAQVEGGSQTFGLSQRLEEQTRLFKRLLDLTDHGTDAKADWFHRFLSMDDRTADLYLLLVPSGACARALVATSGDDLYTEALSRLCDEAPQPPAAALANTQEAVFRALQLPLISPELREGFSMTLGTERLLARADVRGDLHMHTDESDGRHTLVEMVEACVSRGYQYMAITDHSQSLGIAHGLSVARLQRQREAILRLRDKYPEITILHGTEVDILQNNTLDFADDVLEALDIVVASIHTGFHQSPQEITARVLYAVEHPHVDIIAHPTGRMLGRRDPYGLDLMRVFEKAGKKVALEHNCNPARLDLDPQWLRAGLEAGCLFCIDSDAHSTHDLARLDDYGVTMARKGWLPPQRVLNTYALPTLLTWLKTPKNER